jgi:protein-S-isoprenylcysteine O-methyltransferase Ste14
MREFLFKYRGKIPLPLMVAVLIWLFSRPQPPERNYTIIWVGLGISLVGEAIRIWAVGYAGASTRGKQAKAKQLVTGGPYSYVRNPIYIGNFLVSLGAVLTIQSWVVAAIFVFYFALVYHLIVEHEESYLGKEFGAAYRSYTEKVSRFFPSLTPYDRPQGEFRWRELRKEYWSVLGLTMAFLLINLSPIISNWIRNG